MYLLSKPTHKASCDVTNKKHTEMQTVQTQTQTENFTWSVEVFSAQIHDQTDTIHPHHYHYIICSHVRLSIPCHGRVDSDYFVLLSIRYSQPLCSAGYKRQTERFDAVDIQRVASTLHTLTEDVEPVTSWRSSSGSGHSAWRDNVQRRQAAADLD